MRNALGYRILSTASVLALGFGPTISAIAHEPVAAALPKPPAPAASVTALPPLPEGVSELAFSNLFKMPIGRYGLEVTDVARGLDGKKVRVLGYMVKQSERWTNQFLLAPVPVQLHEHEYGLADDLPASTLLVRVPSELPSRLTYTPRPLLLCGTFRLGPEVGPGGRTLAGGLTLEPQARVASAPGGVDAFSSTGPEASEEVGPAAETNTQPQTSTIERTENNAPSEQ